MPDGRALEWLDVTGDDGSRLEPAGEGHPITAARQGLLLLGEVAAEPSEVVDRDDGIPSREEAAEHLRALEALDHRGRRRGDDVSMQAGMRLVGGDPECRQPGAALALHEHGEEPTDPLASLGVALPGDAMQRLAEAEDVDLQVGVADRAERALEARPLGRGKALPGGGAGAIERRS